MRTWRSALSALVAGGAAVVTLSAASPAGALLSVTCRAPRARLVFVGEVTQIRGATVDFHVTAVRSGKAGVAAIEVDYPTKGNVRFLEPAASYRVGASLVQGRYRSMVPTAQDDCAGQIRTNHLDGSAIDTGTFTEAQKRLPGIARTVAIVVLGSLALLIVIGRLFDRRRAYN